MRIFARTSHAGRMRHVSAPHSYVADVEEMNVSSDWPVYEGLYAFTLYGRTCPESEHEGHGFPCWKMLDWDRIATAHLEGVISKVGDLIEERYAGRRPEPTPPDQAHKPTEMPIDFLALVRARARIETEGRARAAEAGYLSG